MARRLLLLLLLPLFPGCQNATPRQASTSSAASPAHPDFSQNTVQTYDIQTGEFQQQPPFGDRSNRSQ
jgi:hypothetical protein